LSVGGIATSKAHARNRENAPYPAWVQAAELFPSVPHQAGDLRGMKGNGNASFMARLRNVVQSQRTQHSHESSIIGLLLTKKLAARMKTTNPYIWRTPGLLQRCSIDFSADLDRTEGRKKRHQES
jgi:hypothetical protein